MKTTLALWAFKFFVAYVRRNPELLARLGHVIPGHLDDDLIATIIQLIKQSR